MSQVPTEIILPKIISNLFRGLSQLIFSNMFNVTELLISDVDWIHVKIYNFKIILVVSGHTLNTNFKIISFHM